MSEERDGGIVYQYFAKVVSNYDQFTEYMMSYDDNDNTR